jgi:hypothetical protein
MTMMLRQGIRMIVFSENPNLGTVKKALPTRFVTPTTPVVHRIVILTPMNDFVRHRKEPLTLQETVAPAASPAGTDAASARATGLLVPHPARLLLPVLTVWRCGSS